MKFLSKRLATNVRYFKRDFRVGVFIAFVVTLPQSWIFCCLNDFGFGIFHQTFVPIRSNGFGLMIICAFISIVASGCLAVWMTSDYWKMALSVYSINASASLLTWWFANQTAADDSLQVVFSSIRAALSLALLLGTIVWFLRYKQVFPKEWAQKNNE
jgi:hypothetical protein